MHGHPLDLSDLPSLEKISTIKTISKIKRTPRAIWVIVQINVIILILLSVIKGARWFWIGWEISGAILVAYGCFQEWNLLFRREGSVVKRLERGYAILVAIGVTMEMIGLFHEIPAALKMEKVMDGLEQTNLQLSIILEKLRQPRKMSQEQINGFIKFSNNLQKPLVRIGGKDATPECVAYIESIQKALVGSGYKIISRMDYRDAPLIPFPLSEGKDFWMFVNKAETPKPPATIQDLNDAFFSVGIPPEWSFTDDPSVVNTNEVLIYVLNKF